MAATVTIDFNANLARFSSSIDKATADLNKFQTNAQRMASNVKGAFATLGTGIAVGAITAFAKSTLDAADALNDMSQRTGVAVKDLASLRTVAEQNGTSLEDVGKAISKLNLSFSQAQGGSKEQAEAFKRLGVNSADARERLFQLADAYQKANGDTRVLADLQKVLGKSYAELIPLLAQGGDELRKAAEASESFAQAMARLAPEADKFNDQLAQLKTNAAGLSASLLSAVVPSLNEYLAALQRITSEGTLLEKLGFFTLGYVPERIANDVGNLTDRIKGYREEIAKLKAEGKDTGALEKTLGELITRQVEILQKPPKRTAGTAAPFASAAKSAGRAATDPLASIIGATDIAKMQEYEKLLTALNARYDFGRKNADLYAQALEVLNKKFGIGEGGLIDALGTGSFKTGSQDVAKFIQEQQEAINGLNGEMAAEQTAQANEYASALSGLLDGTDVAKTEALQKSIELLNEAFFAGTIGAEQYQQAIDNITGSGKADAALKSTKSLAEELGLVFESTFEKAISAGGSFQDILKGLLADVIKLIARIYVLEPLLESIKSGATSTGGTSGGSGFNIGSLFSDIGSGIASFFNFANGGVMTGAGAMPLHRYASGGIANSPQLAMFGEGSRPEAYVPLPDGRRIPVHMAGGGGQVIQNITIQTDNPATVRASRGQLAADFSNQVGRLSKRWG